MAVPAPQGTSGPLPWILSSFPGHFQWDSGLP